MKKTRPHLSWIPQAIIPMLGLIIVLCFIALIAYSSHAATVELRHTILPLPECSDIIDNDGDGLIDWPNDPECLTAQTASESPAPSGDSSSGGSSSGGQNNSSTPTASTPIELTADFNNDGKVDISDFSALTLWVDQGIGPSQYDLNNDDSVDYRDVSILVYQWSNQ